MKTQRRAGGGGELPWQEIANHLESSCTRDAAGGSSWGGQWFEDCQLILTAYAGFDPDTCASDRRAVIWDALNDAAGRGMISEHSLRSALRNAVAKYKRKPTVPFIYVAQLSVAQVRTPVVFRFRGATLTITQHLPRRFDRTFLDGPRRYGNIAADEDGHAWARVHVRARTAPEAQSKAANALDFYRGAANFALVGNIWHASASDGAKPLNELLLGPSYTLHDPSGAPAIEMYWYEPHYRKFSTITCIGEKWQRAHSVALTMRKQINRSQYGDELYRTMIRYCRTLDSGDPGLVLLRLWGVLESLTGTVRDRGDELVRRAAGMYRESAVVRGTLEVMRNRRNRIAHAGVDDESDREDVVMLHRFVARGILLAFQKSTKYSGLDEIGQFLALPNSKAELERGIELRRDAILFRRAGK